MSAVRRRRCRPYGQLGVECKGCFFKFGVEVGGELSIVNALYRLRITDQLFNLTLLHEWCALNRLSNAYFDAKFKKTPFRLIPGSTVAKLLVGLACH
jgi:hypothetical protein